MPLPKTWSLNEGLSSADLNAQFVYVNSLVPVGSAFAFFDYNGVCTFDANIFKYMNGQTVSDAASPLNGLVLTDTSNRYLVGFGTEAGADIGTAAWSVTPLGNASHQVSIAHTHVAPAHTHTGPSHTHTGPSHTHSAGTLQFKTVYTDGTNYIYAYTSTGSLTSIAGNQSFFYGTSGTTKRYGTTSAVQGYTKDGTGATGSGGTGNTGASGTDATGNPNITLTTDSGGSATQSIQVRSIPCRWIIRYK